MRLVLTVCRPIICTKRYWFFEPLEAVRTTILMSALGVFYAQDQDQGLLVAAFISIILAFCFFYLQPYGAQRASILQCTVHLAIGGVYVCSLLKVRVQRYNWLPTSVNTHIRIFIRVDDLSDYYRGRSLCHISLPCSIVHTSKQH